MNNNRPKILFEPTKNQQEVKDKVFYTLQEGRESSVKFISVSAPAGSGKTTLAESIILSHSDKYIGYFVFNASIKSEMENRAKYKEINNSEFYTFHGFMRKQAIELSSHNAKFKSIFFHKDGTSKIRENKKEYHTKEIKKAILKTKSKLEIKEDIRGATLTLLLLGIKNEISKWAKSDKNVSNFSRSVLVEDLANIDNFRGYIANGKEKDLTINDKNQSMLELKEILEKIDISNFIKNILFNTIMDNDFTHDSYYKMVYSLSVENNIDIFKNFDFLIIDEAQDTDPLIKRLFNASNKLKILFGDTSQGINAFRGVMDFMAEVSKREDSLSFSTPTSFRFSNDISVFSNQILETQDNTEGYTPLISNYTENPSTIKSKKLSNHEGVENIRNSLLETIQSKDFFYRVGGLDTAKKTDIKKYLSKHTAVLSRNNATLIETTIKLFDEINKTSFLSDNKGDKKRELYKKIEDMIKRDIVFNEKKTTLSKALGEMKIFKEIDREENVDEITRKQFDALYELITDKRSIKILNEFNSVLKSIENFKDIKSEQESIKISSYINFSFSKKNSEEFKSIFTLEFTEQIQKEIIRNYNKSIRHLPHQEDIYSFEEYKRIKYINGLKDIKSFINLPEVKSVLNKNKSRSDKYSFLYDDYLLKNFLTLAIKLNGESIRQREIEKHTSLSKKSLHKLLNKEFPKEIINKIKESIKREKKEEGVLFSEFTSIENFLKDNDVKEVLLSEEYVKDYGFLCDEKGLEVFLNYVQDNLKILAESRMPTVLLGTVHSVKGEEFNNVYLLNDLMRISEEEEKSSDEELKLAYVGVTRVKENLYFMESGKRESKHFMYDFFNEKREQLEKALDKPFLFTFTQGITLELEKVKYSKSDLWKYTLKKDGKIITDNEDKSSLAIFFLDKPMSVIHLGYKNNIPFFLKYKTDKSSKDKMSFLRLNGEEISPHESYNLSHSREVFFRIGVASQTYSYDKDKKTKENDKDKKKDKSKKGKSP